MGGQLVFMALASYYSWLEKDYNDFGCVPCIIYTVVVIKITLP